LRIKTGEVLPDDLIRLISLDPFGAWIPGDNVPGRIQHENRILIDTIYQKHQANGAEIAEEFKDAWRSLVQEGFATVDGDDVRLTRKGLLQVDTLLPRFFEPEHRGIRYT